MKEIFNEKKDVNDLDQVTGGAFNINRINEFINYEYMRKEALKQKIGVPEITIRDIQDVERCREKIQY